MHKRISTHCKHKLQRYMILHLLVGDESKRWREQISRNICGIMVKQNGATILVKPKYALFILDQGGLTAILVMFSVCMFEPFLRVNRTDFFLENILISGLSSHLLAFCLTYLVLWYLYMCNSWTHLTSNIFLFPDFLFICVM